MGTPSAMIYLCSGVPLSTHYDHVLMFDNKQKQLDYFHSKVVRTLTQYTYLRKHWSIKVQAGMTEAEKWNYLFFHNVNVNVSGGVMTAEAEKDYFYFITDVQYINDNTVEIFLEMDIMQTYQFDMKFQRCFIERMHQRTDEPGQNLIDEGLELGELVVNETHKFAELDELCIMVLASINPNSESATPIASDPKRYNDVFSGIEVFAVYGPMWQALGQRLNELSSQGHIDGIVSMWMYPKELVEISGEWEDETLFKSVKSCRTLGDTFYIEKTPGTIDGYTPVNKKLLTYPYNFLYCSNNMGGSAVYHYEQFHGNLSGGNLFSVFGSVSPDAPMLLVPCDYKGCDLNYEEGLSLGGFPSCAWDADIYKMWLAQNQNMHAFSNAQGQIKVAAGAATAAVGGLGNLLTGNIGGAMNSVLGGATMAYSGLSQIGELLAQKKDMEIQPPQSRGHFSSSVNVTAGIQNYVFYRKSISAARARIIDDYFTMYGYKVNRINNPKQKTRENYTYVKTVNCVCYGALPQAIADRIGSIFDKGVTLWWNADVFGDYSAGNPIIVAAG